MKKLVLPIITFVLGIVLGAVIIWFKFLVPEGKGVQLIYSSFVGGQADTAFQLRFGSQKEFLKNFESSLPAYVQMLHAFGNGTNNYHVRQALWKVKAYYAATGISIPTNIAGILNALPPLPVTEEDLSQSKSTLTKVGEISPIFFVQTIDGQDLDFHGKVVVLNFFATWCGPCMEEMPSLEKDIGDRFRDEGAILVSVGQGETQSQLERFQRQHPYSFPVVADPDRKIYHKFATAYIPRNVVIGKDGRIKFQSVGYTPQDFAALVNAVKGELGK